MKKAKHIYDKPVILYCYQEDIDGYSPIDGLPTLHAHINTANFALEKYEGKAMQYDVAILAYFRYSPILLNIALHPQLYRMRYNDNDYDIVGGDDYQMNHQEVCLKAVIINGGR